MFDRATEQDVVERVNSILRLLENPTPALSSALAGMLETPLERYMKKMCQL